MIVRAKSYARAGLVGNPSDGYHGKTISFIVRNFEAEVELWESPELEIIPSQRDHTVFDDIEQLSKDVGYFGYYGGIRLLKATVKRFHDYCLEHGIALGGRNFTLRYCSDVPAQVGMAGSSAIIAACLRALMGFYGVEMPRPIQANLILSVERDELGIPAGLQDRVIQAFEGLVFMDFAREHFDRQGYGDYEELDIASLPNLYIAYSTKLSEGTEVFHSDIRGRFERREPEVIDAMAEWAELAGQTRDLLVRGRGEEIGALLDRNFDLRRHIYEVSEGNIQMVDVARAQGASAKFTGSGGAIVGTYEDEAMYRRLVEALAPLDMEVIQPAIAEE